MKPTILFVDQFSDLGGSQRGLLDLLPALQDDFVARFALPGPGTLTEELERRGVTWNPIPLGQYDLGSKSIANLAAYAARQPRLVAAIAELARESSLIYATGPRVFPATALAARMTGVPLLWHLNLEILAARDRAVVEAAAAVGRPAIVSCSQACLNTFGPRSYLRRTGRVVYNGIAAIERTTPEPGPVIGLIGRIHPDKGQADLMDAAPEISNAFPEVRFRLIGPVADAAYFERLKRQSVPFDFRGEAANAGDALRGLGILVIPSRREAASRVVLEAFSACVPVVASDAGGMPEIVRESGIIFPRGAPKKLAAAVIRLLSDPDLRLRMIQSGLEAYERWGRLERFQAEIRAEIERQIGPPPQSP